MICLYDQFRKTVAPTCSERERDTYCQFSGGWAFTCGAQWERCEAGNCKDSHKVQVECKLGHWGEKEEPNGQLVTTEGWVWLLCGNGEFLQPHSLGSFVFSTLGLWYMPTIPAWQASSLRTLEFPLCFLGFFHWLYLTCDLQGALELNMFL